ncbi:uncharacterized protein LTR77_004494 [Saxophila tyrrhenica]|uniref:AHC1-like C2H2 zinc-finger domain-containing protein n=1 Tax=Saxophila tyrrhenica TaxID=1690608 RepID=A0AAV9PH84_9PEZI|nr:hypothetical protein LTR77_004494 [Saxophila tyrrhenica]
MQSIFRLPWCSDPIAPKSDHAVLEKMRASPVVEIPALQKLKRKRTNSSEMSPSRAQDNKKARTGHYELPPIQVSNFQAGGKPSFTETPAQISEASPALNAPAMPARPDTERHSPNAGSLRMTGQQTPPKPADTPRETNVMALQVPASEDAKGYTPLQQVIENEFNMQILMKHNELRLIEQELAKCQTALEQLRRCELRPYPGSERPSEALTSGTGPAVAPPPGFTRPSHPAPHGVTDGPYSRHYKHWLLQDPQFDSVPVQSLQPEAAARPTRNSGPTSRRLVNQAFSFPGRPSERLPAIPNYPPPAPAKDRNLPNVLRRSTDGKLVKLICNNCQRGNFSSIQGFLNHCRIAHKVDYKSHDAAAIDCGQPLDESEAATLPPETQHTPVPKPPPSRAPAAAAPSTSTPHRANFVHPFNSSTGSSVKLNQPRHPIAPRQPVQSLSSATSTTAQSSFTPAAQLPRLSAHFAKHHVGGDLAKAAEEAKQKIDLSSEELPSPAFSEQPSPSGTPTGARSLATAGRTGTLGINSGSIPRPPSRKGFRQIMPQSKARPSPLAPMPPNDSSTIKHEHEHSESPASPHSHDHSIELSPHTADSNPGLVSDHEDDDEHGSASESEEGPAPHSPATRPIPVPGNRTSCADNVEIDVAVDGEEVERDGVVIRRNSVSDEGGKFGASGKRGV